MQITVVLIIALILGVASLFLLVKGSRNEYDDYQSDEDQIKYLEEWREDHCRIQLLLAE